MFKHILIPVDGSKRSLAAARQGVGLAKSLGAKITAFYVAPAYHPRVYGDVVPRDFVTPQQYEAAMSDTANDVLGAVEKLAGAAGVPCTTTWVESDYPAAAIVKSAATRKCDLVFMASHGRRGLAALVLGSETMKVLTHSKVPVLVHRR